MSNKNKFTKIHTEKVWKDGKKHRKILKIENVVPFVDLPDQYITGKNPAYWLKDDELRVFDGNALNLPVYRFKPGDVIDEKSFRHIVSLMKRAGDALRRIRCEIWHGTEVVEI